MDRLLNFMGSGLVERSLALVLDLYYSVPLNRFDINRSLLPVVPPASKMPPLGAVEM